MKSLDKIAGAILIPVVALIGLYFILAMAQYTILWWFGNGLCVLAVIGFCVSLLVFFIKKK